MSRRPRVYRGHGMEVVMLGDTHPVVFLDKTSEFYEHASWMLQSALGADVKAEALYHVTTDDTVASMCRRWGLSGSDVGLAKLKRADLRSLKAVGTSGRRSFIFSLVLAIALDGRVPLDDFRRDLWSYSLIDAFLEVLQSCQRLVSEGEGGEAFLAPQCDGSGEGQGADSSNRRSGNGRSDSRSPLRSVSTKRKSPLPALERYVWKSISPASSPVKAHPPLDAFKANLEVEATDVTVICDGKVPVITLAKASPFQEFVAQWLQALLDTTGKAGGLYEYVHDSKIFLECERVGLHESQVYSVRLKGPSLAHIMAVGANGKRSVLLSLCVSLLLNGVVNKGAFIQKAIELDPEVAKEARILMDSALSKAGLTSLDDVRLRDTDANQPSGSSKRVEPSHSRHGTDRGRSSQKDRSNSARHRKPSAKRKKEKHRKSKRGSKRKRRGERTDRSRSNRSVSGGRSAGRSRSRRAKVGSPKPLPQPQKNSSGSIVVTCEEDARRPKMPRIALMRENVCVVYKPPHWTCTTSADDNYRRPKSNGRLQDWIAGELSGQFPEFFRKAPPQGGLIHRLDVETSGPMLIATSHKILSAMRDQLQQKLCYKEYIALMHGSLPLERCCGKLKYRLLTSHERGGSLTKVDDWGTMAETQYKAEKFFQRRVPGQQTRRYTLVRVNIITGKTHQIRVHLRELGRELGFPIRGLVGDYKYLSPSQKREDYTFCERVFLHAQGLEFTLPESHEHVAVQCPLPAQLQQALDKLDIDEVATAELEKLTSFLGRTTSGSVSHPARLLRSAISGTAMNGRPGRKRGHSHQREAKDSSKWRPRREQGATWKRWTHGYANGVLRSTLGTHKMKAEKREDRCEHGRTRDSRELRSRSGGQEDRQADRDRTTSKRDRRSIGRHPDEDPTHCEDDRRKSEAVEMCPDEDPAKSDDNRIDGETKERSSDEYAPLLEESRVEAENGLGDIPETLEFEEGVLDDGYRLPDELPEFDVDEPSSIQQ